MPVNQKENLFIVAMEECSELTKELSKCLRFGLDNHKPDNPDMLNSEALITEYAQLCGTMERLFKENGITVDEHFVSEIKEFKNSKVDLYFEETKRVGI